MTSLAENLRKSANEHPGRVAVKLQEAELSYQQLWQASGRVATLLGDRGVTAGDRVGLMLPNVPHFPALYYGILRAGATVVPMNVLLKEREVRYYLQDSQAKLLFAWEEFAACAHTGARAVGADCLPVSPGAVGELLSEHPSAAENVPREDSDTAVILYTSGTTGAPKGAELTNANLAANAQVVAEMFAITAEDVIFGGLPLFHSFGQTCAMNAGIRQGASLTLLPRFDPAEALSSVARDRVTVFEGVPTMYVAILNCPEATTADTSSLRLCASGGASLPLEVIRGFEERFHCMILEGYGLSESSPVASFNHPDRPRKAGSVGTPVEGVRMTLLDDAGHEVAPGEVGEIAIAGHNVMKGYWRNPEATAQTIVDGWLATGDIGRVDEDGYYFIVDRKKDMIIRGGYNVYPREVEEVLYEHPDVIEAAVIGIPDQQLGEEVAAAVALREGARTTPEMLRRFTSERVAAYKYPRRIWLVESLPKGPTGKILKREITIPEEEM